MILRLRKIEDKIIIKMSKSNRFRAKNEETNFRPKAPDVCSDTHLNNPLHNLGLINTINDISKNAAVHSLPYNRAVNYYDLMRVMEAASVQRKNILDLSLDPQCLLQRLHNVGVHGPAPEDDHVNLRKHMQVSSQLTDLTGHQFLPPEILDKVADLMAPEKNLPDWSFIRRYHALRSRLEQGVILTMKPGRHSLRADLKAYRHWRVAELMGGLRGGYVVKTSIDGFGEIYLSSRHVIIKNEYGNWLGTRDHYLMLHDCVVQRWVCCYSVCLASYLKQTNYPSLEVLLKVFQWGDTLINIFGNDGYAAIKIWESLIYGLIMASEHDPVVDSQLFLNNMQSDLFSSVPGDDGFVQRTWEELRDQTLKGLNLHQLSQLHGLYRIWGHPSINILEGLAKLRQVACTPRLPCATSIRYQLVSWREQFCVGYYNAEHRWPNLEILESMPSDSLLRKCLESGSPLPLNSPHYSLDDWTHIKFKQTFCVPAKFDLNSTTKDSATSLGFQELKERLQSSGSIGSASERSVIMRFLEREWTTPNDFLQKINNEGFDPDESVIGLREKERELSSSGRFFGLLPIEKRIYVVVTEAMIAEELLPYIPEITMTYNLVKLREHIQRATRKLKMPEEKTVTVVTNMDFVKWNSNMREEETGPLFKDIDHLFGFENLVSRTYEMFRESQMYLANGHVLPEISRDGSQLETGPTVWSRHLGGVEGLRQKGWTLFTVSLIKRVARILGLNCTLMGQGDNQVLVTTYSCDSKRSFSEQHEEFINTLTRCLASIGPPLKPEETWSSSHLFSYGKYAVWKGAPLSNGLKMIIKMARMTNEGLQNLASTLSSMTANCTAATDVDLTPLIAYLVCSLESSVAVELALARPCYAEESLTTPSRMDMFRIPSDAMSVKFNVKKDDRIFQQVSKFTVDGLLMLLISPSSLGGYPVCHYWSLQMHGFPDQLSLDIQGLKAAYSRSQKVLLKTVIKRLLFPPLNHNVNPVMLCQDPYSLNLLHGSTSIDKIKGMVMDFLVTSGQDFIRNQHFLNFLSLATADQKELGDLLYKCDHLHPRVCNAILESTVVGKVNQALAKVTKTGVLVNLMLKFKFSDAEKMYARIRLDQYENAELSDLNEGAPKKRKFFELFGAFEQNQLNCLIHTICSDNEGIPQSEVAGLCSYRHAKALRDTSWQKSIEGVTVAVPWELLTPRTSYAANCELDEHPCVHGGYIATQVIGTTDLEYLSGKTGSIAMGPVSPYLGKGTRNKVDYEAKKLAESAPPILRNALTLLQLVGWATHRESKLSELIFKIVESITDAPARHLAPLPDEIAGTFGHRFDDVKTSRMCTSSIIPTGASYITSNTNHFKPEQLYPDIGTDNLHVQFQSIFLFIQHYLSVKHTFTGYPTENQSIHWHINCPRCVYPVDEAMIDIEAETIEWEKFSFLKRQPQNPYLWVPVETLPDQLLPTVDWGKVISIPDPCDIKLKNDLLVQAMAYDVMKHHGLTSPAFRTTSEGPVYEIPVTIINKLEFVPFIQEIIYMLFLRLCWIHATQLDYHETRQAMLPWLSGHLNTLRQVPISWFDPFHRLLDHPDNLSKALARWSQLSPPIGSPPTKAQISFFFQELFRREIDDPSFLDRFQTWCHPNYRKDKLQLLHQGLSNHPVSKWAMSKLLSGNTDDRIWHFTRFLKDEALLFSDSNVTSVSDLSFLAKNPETAKRHLDALSVGFAMRRFLRLKPNTKFVAGTHHGVAASIPSRIRPSDVEPELIQNDGSNQIRAAPIRLPSILACNRLAKCQGQEHPRSLTTTLDKILPDWEMSNINHLFKPFKNPTTAHYKLLSVLVYCHQKGINWNSGQGVRYFGLADGDGGFCSLLHKVWPNVEIVYNSLYDLRKLSHTGASSIRPSSIYSTDSLIRKVVGLQLVEEGMSDLTEERTLNAIIRNFPSGELVVCDAEGEGINSPEKEIKLAQQVSLLSHTVEAKVIIYKTYTKSLGLCFSIVNIWLACYDRVDIMRSSFSGYGNTEVYLIIRNRLTERRNFPVILTREGSSEITISNFRYRGSWYDFCRPLSSQNLYQNIPALAGKEYTLSVSPYGTFTLWTSEVYHLIVRYSGTGVFKFPESFFRTINQHLAPVTLARSTPATWVISYFTPAIKTEIFSHFCYCWALTILAQNDSPLVWSEWVNYIAHLKLVCYQTVKGNWSIWPMSTGDDWPQLTACVVISEGDISEAARKNIIAFVGRFKMCRLDAFFPLIATGFSHPVPAWSFSRIGRRKVPEVFADNNPSYLRIPWSLAPIPCAEWVRSNPNCQWFYTAVSSRDRIKIKRNYYRLLDKVSKGNMNQ